jgi:hypothetical protein
MKRSFFASAAFLWRREERAQTAQVRRGKLLVFHELRDELFRRAVEELVAMRVSAPRTLPERPAEVAMRPVFGRVAHEPFASRLRRIVKTVV